MINLNLNKIADEIVKKAKNKDDIYNIIINNSEINNDNISNLKKLMKISINKYLKKKGFSKNTKNTEKIKLLSKNSDNKNKDFTKLMSEMIYKTIKQTLS